VLLLVGGCERRVEEGRAVRPDSKWRFSIAERVVAVAPPELPVAQMSGDTIRVTGQFNTGCGHELVSGAARYRSVDSLAVLELGVRAHTSANFCGFIETTYDYEFAVATRGVGPHVIRVFHYGDSAADTTYTPILVDTLVGGGVER
jgi:hypothetical protein